MELFEISLLKLVLHLLLLPTYAFLVSVVSW